MNKTKLEKGITLIALVITIIVLLILAGISISMLTGENGILNRAVTAREKTEKESLKEMARTDILGYQAENKSGNVTAEQLREVLDKYFKDVPETAEELENKLEDENYSLKSRDEYGKDIEVKVSEIYSGIISTPETGLPTLDQAIKQAENFAKDGNKEITDGKDTMWVPQDFKVVEGESIETGVVIEDGAKNQFVWVPVPDINAMYTDNEEKNDTIIDNLENELRSNFNKMRASVDYYKGFYIGRYETSDLETEKPKVQQGKEATTDIDFYTRYKNSENITYKNETEKITSVTSSMIWDCQWDATLNWFLRSEDEKIRGYVTDSTGKGWYWENSENSKKPTGTPIGNNENEVNKIWDMAGNVFEWTLEVDNTKYRVYRGGEYFRSGSAYPVSCRWNDLSPYSSVSASGSRCTLYINQ